MCGFIRARVVKGCLEVDLAACMLYFLAADELFHNTRRLVRVCLRTTTCVGIGAF